jgi:chromosome segregation ATPase
MIESIMYFGIGFLVAALSVLVVVPLVHGRAVRLTTRRLEGAMPSSMSEILADKDLLRAEFAMSTRRLEVNVEQLKTKSASQLAELDKRGDAITRLKIELGALRDQLRATEEEFAVKATGVQKAEPALSDKELELAKLRGELDERSCLADAQKIEIIALKIQVEGMKERLDGASQATAVQKAEYTLSDKESELAKLRGELDERSSLADAQKIEIIALKTQVEALKEQLDSASHQLRATEEEFTVKATAVQKAECTLSDKESELAKLRGELDERSSLADAQKIEIIALKTQVEALKEQLDSANNELKTMEDRRDAERIELKAATQKLVEERGKFQNFHRRVAELVRQLVAQTTEDKILGPGAQDLENRLVEQSRLLDESEFELKHLRGDIEIARKAEADLRIAVIEIDGRASTATQNLKAEKEKLQAALDRANGERTRLAYELAIMKRRVEESRAA